MNMLVINLTRFGDLLQSQPLIHALKAQGHRVGLLCLKNFAPATALLEGVDYAAALPGGTFLASLDADWPLALQQVQRFVDELQAAFPVEGIVNTTATLSARLLTHLLRPASALPAGPESAFPVWGFGLDADGFGINGNSWTTFLQASTLRRLNSPFNIVDMFRMASGCGDVAAVNALRPPQGHILEESKLLLQERAARPWGPSPDCAGYVAFQLGASEARRQWPIASFARLGQWLWEQWRLCPLLLGAPGEIPLAEAYALCAAEGEQPAAYVDCVGATDIPHLAGLLRCSRLLVTNDTGTMHLAAGLDVPVVALFLATAQAWDTGPYRADCCCLEPALPCHPCAFDSACSQGQACLHSIRPESVWALVQGYVRTGQWERPADSALLQGARVWITGRDSRGFADLRCLSGHETEDRSLWLRLQRYFYRQIIDDMDRGCARPGACAEALASLPSPLSPVPPQLQEAAQGLSEAFRTGPEGVHHVLRQAESLLHLVQQQGAMAQQTAIPLAGQKFLASCHRVHSLLEQCAPLCALGYVWTVLLQERGGDLNAILRMAGVLQQSLGAWRKCLESGAACSR